MGLCFSSWGMVPPILFLFREGYLTDNYVKDDWSDNTFFCFGGYGTENENDPLDSGMWKHLPQLMALLGALWTDAALLYEVRSVQTGFQNLQLSSTYSFFFLCVCSWRCDLLPFCFCDLLPSLPIRMNSHSSGNIRQNKLPLPNVTLFIAFFHSSIKVTNTEEIYFQF